MKNKILAIVAVGLLAGPMAANATLVTLDFDVLGTEGPNAGSTASGFLTFDDSLFTGAVGAPRTGYTGPLVDFSFSWGGFSWDEGDVLAGLSINLDGSFNSGLLGSDCTAGAGPGSISCSVGVGSGDFAMFLNGLQSFGFYGPAGLDRGTTTVGVRTVPEPTTLSLLGLGLAGLGFARRRKHA